MYKIKCDSLSLSLLYQPFHKIIMDQKHEINDLKTRRARLEAIIISSLIVDGTTNNGTDS